MKETKVRLWHEVQGFLRQARDIQLWNYAARGVALRVREYPNNVITISFAGRKHDEVRIAILNTLIFFMCFHPMEDIHFDMAVDYGDWGNLMVSVWLCASYFVFAPFLCCHSWVGQVAPRFTYRH